MTDFLSFLFIKLLLSSFFQDYLAIRKNISNKKTKVLYFSESCIFYFQMQIINLIRF